MAAPTTNDSTSNEATIIVFAKAPEPGKVKTRLTSKLTPEQAATLHQQLALRTIAMATLSTAAKVELWCAPNTKHDFFTHCTQNYPLTLHQQVGDNLGQRMYNAISNVLTRSKHCLIIGTDCPQLTLPHLDNTFSLLSSENDCVITPATDGGYVMLGLKQCDKKLFDNIEWGTDSVYETTLTRLQSLSWRWLPQPVLNDIDRPSDLHLLRNIDLPAPISF
ncbi:MAG: TIGR04282 family arsenosugar biosynthesis glycosyltransferase [Thiotrichales bacterium]|nr:TIGR04282 family arsenosugar biosynthesis glycosyltransferase [Thiotrichales bacterium]